jgi:hypothetical protein
VGDPFHRWSPLWLPSFAGYVLARGRAAIRKVFVRSLPNKNVSQQGVTSRPRYNHVRFAQKRTNG